MEKDRLFCFGNSQNVECLIGRSGYFGDSEEEIQQQIDSGAAVKKCSRIHIGTDYFAFYPEITTGMCSISYKYFYCVDSNLESVKKIIPTPDVCAPLDDVKAYALQQLKILLQQEDSVPLQFIYNYASAAKDSKIAQDLFDFMHRWYGNKQCQLRDALIEELSDEGFITSDVLRAYANKLDDIDNLVDLAEDFDSLQELLDEYNL